MFDGTLTPIIIVGLFALAVGLLAFMAAFTLFSGEHKVEKRFDAIAKTKANRAGARQDVAQDRRKQVQDTLKYAEQRRAAKNKVPLRVRLMRAGLEATPQQFYIASGIAAAIGFAGSFFGGLNIVASGLIGFACGLGLPRWIIRFLAKRRQKKFSDEFANAIDVIVRGVKTGLPLNECLSIIARESPEPVRSEFADLVDAQRLGVPIGECFERMMDRIPLPEVNFFAIVIAIQQGAGGNLAEALGNLSNVLRARKMLMAKVQALSAEAKTSAIVLGGLPFIVMLMVYMTSPDYIMLLFTEQVGHVVLAGAAIWMGIGIFVMRQMINFKY
jgi:tight adherence protein B